MNATRIASPQSNAVRISFRVLTGRSGRRGVQTSIAADAVRSTLVRRLLPALLVVTTLIAACGGSGDSSPVGPSTPEDPPAGPPESSIGASGWEHDFVATTVDGTAIDAGDYEGQDLVLWFWAPW